MKNVLIVEDKRTEAENLAKIVQMADCNIRIFFADSRVRAYEIILEHTIDLILVDIILNPREPNDLSGIWFVQNLREIDKYKFTPIIMVTSLEDPKMYTYSELHCYGFIEKPYDADYVLGTIKSALEYKRPAKDKKDYVYKSDGVVYFVDKDEIIYIEYCGKKITMHTVDDDFTIPYIPLSKLLDRLDSDTFLKCNRGCIINRKYVYMSDQTNRMVYLRGADKPLHVGPTVAKNMFMEMLNV